MKKKCSVDGCEKPSRSLGCCSGHYAQICKYGKITNAVLIPNKDKKVKCSIDGCNEKHSCNGYCQRHYSQFRRHGRIISVERMNSPKIGQKMKSGYMYILKNGHPSADKRGYVKRSRLVWEENTGHVVTPPEVVHHRNEIKIDDQFKNLKLLPNKSAHVKEHGGRIGGVRIVTKDMVIEEMIRVSKIIDGNLTTRKFNELSNLSSSVASSKFGWNNLKEELCIP